MTEDVTWNYMRLLKNIRMNEKDFNDRRRRFYYLLADMKGIV